MLKEVRPAIVFIIALTLITGLIYPLVMTGIAGVIFPYQAQGSLIEKDGKVIGSELIGQPFANDNYFHSRPSATLGPDPSDPSKTTGVPYNAVNSMGSNLGPTNKALIERVKGEADKLKSELLSQQPLVAPVAAGQTVGTLRVTHDGKPIGEYPVVALEAVPAAGLLGRAWDTLRLWLK